MKYPIGIQTFEKPLPMIYQSGYLTIKGYDRDTESYLLDIPNNEVREGLLTVLANDYFKTKSIIPSISC